MTTTKTRKPTTKQRKLRLIKEYLHPVLRIETATAIDHYAIDTPPSNAGKLYRLYKATKAGATIYDILDGPYGLECDCPAGTFRGKCKHIDAIKTLQSLKMI